MASYTFERLSVQDAGFLWAETPNQPMHVGAVAVFESGPLRTPEGGIDIECYRAQIESVLHWIPRYRQRIEWTPVERWPVWVDDRRFDIRHHVRHISLPRPGTTEQLKEIAARINARRLDRQHALWEVWVIEGLDGGEQFALLNKIHHCMIDGAAGADLSQVLLSPSSSSELNEPMPYMPRPEPRRSELFTDSVARTLSRPVDAFRGWLADSTRSEAERASAGDAGRPTASERLQSLGELVRQGLAPASTTPINGQLGPHRQLEWLTMPLDDVKELRRELGCTINDVVLATVTEAVRRYLFRRRVDHRALDFRISAPVSMRRPEHDRIQGNHVSSWVVPLPLHLSDRIGQLEAIQDTTEALKASNAALGVETLMEAAGWLPGPILERALASLSSAAPVNMIVTNVPGPQFPLYLVGSKLLAMYPIVPLIPGGGLGVALFSYEGKLCWGFNGDDELVPDLSAFMDDVGVSFEELRRATVERYLSRRTAAIEVEEPVESTPEDVEVDVEVDVGADADLEAEGDPDAAAVEPIRGVESDEEEAGDGVGADVSASSANGAGTRTAFAR